MFGFRSKTNSINIYYKQSFIAPIRTRLAYLTEFKILTLHTIFAVKYLSSSSGFEKDHYNCKTYGKLTNELGQIL